MNPSTFTKIFIGFVIITLLAIGLVLIFSLKVTEDHYIHTLSSRLEDFASGVTPLVAKYFDGTPAGIDSIVKEIGAGMKARLTVIDAHGNVLGDSKLLPKSLGNQGMRPEIMKALSGFVGKVKGHNRDLDQEMLFVAVPIKKDGDIVGVLRSSMSLEDVQGLLSEIRRRMGVIALSIAGIAVVASFLISQSLTRPLRDLEAAARQLSLGNFETHVLLRGGPELRALAQTFNRMVDEIRRLFEDASAQKSELASVFSSIEDGLVIIDGDGRITLFNPAFKRITNRDDIREHYYWEVIQSPDLANLVKEARIAGTARGEVVKHSGRIYNVTVSWLEAADSALLIFRDVTDADKVARIKKEIVETISHELRTPLTALKGFLETLEDEVSSAGKQHLEIAQRHAERLTILVNDLLTLSHLEDTSVRLDLEVFDLRELLREVAMGFEANAESKGLGFSVEIPQEPIMIRADRFKIEQVLVNLLSNAFQYTDFGEITAKIEASPKDAFIEISDTGVGIGEEHIPHIFERFYVVDRSRSRVSGGTGLGLAIVKHIVLLHNGGIDVRSKVGVGTTFKVRLPLGERGLTEN